VGDYEILEDSSREDIHEWFQRRNRNMEYGEIIKKFPESTRMLAEIVVAVYNRQYSEAIDIVEEMDDRYIAEIGAIALAMSGEGGIFSEIAKEIGGQFWFPRDMGDLDRLAKEIEGNMEVLERIEGKIIEAITGMEILETKETKH